MRYHCAPIDDPDITADDLKDFRLKGRPYVIRDMSTCEVIAIVRSAELATALTALMFEEIDNV